MTALERHQENTITKTDGFKLAKPNPKWVGEPINNTIQNNKGWFFGSLDPTQKTTIPLVWLIYKQVYLSWFFFLAHNCFASLFQSAIRCFQHVFHKVIHIRQDWSLNHVRRIHGQGA